MNLKLESLENGKPFMLLSSLKGEIIPIIWNSQIYLIAKFVPRDIFHYLMIQYISLFF